MTAVEFRDIEFHRATFLSQGNEVVLRVILTASGHFEITEEDIVVGSGTIRLLDDFNATQYSPLQLPEVPVLDGPDFYQELRVRGYQYSDSFVNVIEARSDGLKSRINWTDNYTTFLDSMLQPTILVNDTRSLFVPLRMKSLRIDPQIHHEDVLEVEFHKAINVIQTDGIEIRELTVGQMTRRRQPDPLLEEYMFIPNFSSNKMPQQTVSRMLLQLLFERISVREARVAEIDHGFPPVIQDFRQSFENTIMFIVFDSILISSNQSYSFPGIETVTLSEVNDKYDLLIVPRMQSADSILRLLNDQAYVVSRESGQVDVTKVGPHPNLTLVSSFYTNEGETWLIYSYQKAVEVRPFKVIRITSDDMEFKWLEELKLYIESESILVYAQDEPLSGILGFYNCLRFEPNIGNVVCFFVDDSTAPTFDINHPFYKDQLDRGFAVNVLRNVSFLLINFIDSLSR